ncbi:MAG: malto-oligosyltrehalose synthase [Desulfatirhabdiaceae bacterium]
MMGVTVSKNVLATYRLQLGQDLGFQTVCNLIPYFRDLGISHLYLSPCLQSASGSTHGYDVVNPSEFCAELGGPAGFDALWKTAARYEIGLVLDIVPNHMAVFDRQNRWWWDVLANGPQSRYAGFFDIRWDHPDPAVRGRILLPVLGDEPDRCIQNRQIQLRRQDSEMVLVYFEHEFPVSNLSMADLLHTTGEDFESFSINGLVEPSPNPPSRDFLVTNRNEFGVLITDTMIQAINTDPVRLKQVLDRQHYQLAFWRRANFDLNYRRFFDIQHLAGVCVEKEAVFEATHGLILEWVKNGRIDGLRIDHPDGLKDPYAYFQRLRMAAPRTWIVVEKILEPGETLDPDWPVAGTTGYDFLNQINGLFVDSRSAGRMTDFYGEFTGASTDYNAIVHKKKCLIIDRLFQSEVSHLKHLLTDCSRQFFGYDISRQKNLGGALTAVLTCFPVYRTYIRPDTGHISDRDRTIVQEALTRARGLQPDITPDIWQLIENILLLVHPGKQACEFVWRFQQLTGPVMAKGVEDTVFYCFNRLVSLNEVGGNPAHFGTSCDDFHAFCQRIQSRWPDTMLASATHDTKRGEDTRIRIGLLSEIPEDWIDAVRQWSRMNAGFRQNGFPDPNTEYFFYQTLVGAWPIGCDRLAPAMLKAVKEAKVYTSWTDPDPVYEAALQTFIETVMGDSHFISDLAGFVETLAWPAMVTSLSQTLIKCTAPGVPDIYQGTELWDRNLVDPDNRRPVDFDIRQQLLDEIGSLPIDRILKRHAEGLPKIFLLQKVLSVRKQIAEAFGPMGDYHPVAASGECARHLVSFIRGDRVLVLAPRLVITLNGDWKNTIIDVPAGRWENSLNGEIHTGGRFTVGRVLEGFPVALLVKKGGIQ